MSKDFEKLLNGLKENGMVVSYDKEPNKYRWHDLRENPNDLPKGCGWVLAWIVSSIDGRIVYPPQVAEYREDEHWHNQDSIDDDFGWEQKVIAWRKIEPFEGMKMKEKIRIIDYFTGETFIEREVIDDKVIDIIIFELNNEIYKLMASLRDEEMIFRRESVITKYRNAIRYYSDIKESLENRLKYAKGL